MLVLIRVTPMLYITDTHPMKKQYQSAFVVAAPSWRMHGKTSID